MGHDRETRKAEGDLNSSPRRTQWQARHLNEETRHWLEEDARYFIHQALSTPCLNVIRSCSGIYLEDLEGRKIMDFHGNNVHQVGFGNPVVMAAVQEELAKLPFCTRRYTNTTAIELARKLTEIAPGDLNKVLFAPGATTAMGMALKLARAVTGRFKTLSAWDSFHGASLDAVSIGGERTFREGIGPLLPGTEHFLPFNSYRCIWGDCDDSASKCLKYLEYVLEREGDVGAIILETIRNTDVQIPPREYLQTVRRLADQHGALLILDETTLALGRTGRMFAFEHYDVIPDMVVVGKGFGGGIVPFAALIAREGLQGAAGSSIGHYTHEKSPVGSAAALATIRYIEGENLLRHTVEMETLFRRLLTSLQAKYPVIGDIRGIGLLFGVELVKDRTTKEKASDAAEQVMYRCLELGLSFKVSQGNVLTFSPPLIIQPAQLQEAVAMLDQALSEL